MNVVSRTDIGRVRSSNQDALLVQHGAYGLYGVADGMGGHRAGDVASSMTVTLLARMLENEKPSEHTLRAAVEEVNRKVYAEQKNCAELNGMGTTLTLLWEDRDTILLGHVGDSRAYLLRNGEIVQKTQDHSMVAEMLRDGLITQEEAERHPYRHVITRAIGTADSIEVDIFRVDKKSGDQWLLCSDGLSEYVTEHEMALRLQNMTLDEAANALLLRALSLGGRDNVTLLLAEVAR